MTEQQTITRKEFPNGDVAVDEGNGLVYRTPDAAYTVELDPPGHPLSGEPFGVDLVRTTRSEHGLEQEQRLTLAEYPSYMSAEEHQREAEKTLFEQGREGLQPAMTLVDTMPYEPDSAMYIVGLYPFEPETDRGTLSLIRLDGEQLDVAPVAHGPIAELTPIEQRLWDVKASGGDTGRLLEAATLEAMWADELAPGTPLFAAEGQEEMTLGKAGSTPEWEDHPDWPDLSAWDQPHTPRPAALVLPVTLDDDMTPFDDRGRYVPHHRDESNTVHFFSVVGRPSDSPLPEDASHELRYFRAQQTEEDMVIHDSLPVMPVADPTLSPWPLPALHLHLEDGDLDTAQKLARNTARDNGLSFPEKLPAIGGVEPEPKPETGWYHFDTALVSATPQGVDDGYSVGVVDVYANYENGQWAARYLPLDEFDTLDEALIYQQQTLISRVAEDRESALATDGFNRSPAAYESIALADADAALVDLLEKYDGHYPPDYDGYEPEWEVLSSREWDAYRDHVRTITEVVPGTDRIHNSLPTATPRFADETLVAASVLPDAPYLQAEDFDPQDIALTWRLDIVPARDPDGAQLGYSAVCTIDMTELVEAVAPNRPERAQWLEVAQFQTEERATKFRDDFMSLVEADELGSITGPELAGVIADDLKMDSGWQMMDKLTLEQLEAEKWSITHNTEDWKPQIGETSLEPVVDSTSFNIEL